MDFIPALKLQSMFSNLFNPSPVTADPNQVMPATPDTNNDMISRIQQLYSPSHEAQDKLNEALNSMPQRKDYKPSLMTNIMSRLSGLSSAGPQTYEGGQALGYKGMGQAGSNTIEAGLDRGYNNAIADWSMKLKPINELAGIEKTNNAQSRMLANSAIQNELRSEELDRKTAKDKAQNQLEYEKLKQKDGFKAYLQKKAEDANNFIRSDSAGRLISVNRVTGKSQYITDSEGDFVMSDKLPDEAKLEVENNNRLAQIEAQGKQTRSNEAVKGAEDRKTAETRGNETRKNITTRGDESRKTKVVVPGKAPTTPKQDKGRVKVISPTGQTGTIPAEQVNDAIEKGYKIVGSK